MRILLVEDDHRLAEPLIAFLEQERHAVTWLSDGAAALDVLLRDAVDLALLDWMLPGLDGLSIVRQLRRQARHTLVLMITARDGVEDLVQGLQEGADDYLVKPFRMVELAARIRSLERRRERPFQEQVLRWRDLRLEVVVAVQDTGIGLTPEERERVFDRLWQARPDRSGEGSGLGLAIAEQLCTAHGGRIAVESEPGLGSCFTVTLPLSPGSG